MPCSPDASHAMADVGAVAEDLADQLGEDPAGAGLDEHPDARRVHALDLVDEVHRAAPPARPAGPGSSAGSVGVGGAGAWSTTPGRGAAPTSTVSSRSASSVAAAATTGLWKAHDTAMRLALTPSSSSALTAASTDRGGARQHGLAGRVVVGDDEVGPRRRCGRSSSSTGRLTAAMAPGSSLRTDAADMMAWPRAR